MKCTRFLLGLTKVTVSTMEKKTMVIRGGKFDASNVRRKTHRQQRSLVRKVDADLAHDGGELAKLTPQRPKSMFVDPERDGVAVVGHDRFADAPWMVTVGYGSRCFLPINQDDNVFVRLWGAAAVQG